MGEQFQSAGHLRNVLEAGDGVPHGDACTDDGRQGRQAVVHVEFADQGHADQVAFSLVFQLIFAAPGRGVVHQHAEVRAQGGTIGFHRHAAGEHFRQAAAVGVVNVDDGHGLAAGFGVRRHLLEQFHLGLEVVFHGMVVVQMVLGQVREDAHIEVDARHAFLVQGVGGDFHGYAAAAVFQHFLQQVFQFQRTRRGVRGGGDFLPVVVGDGADQPGAQPRLLEEGMGNVGRGGFPVCSGDADHGHVAGGVAVPGRSHQADGQPGVVHFHPGDLAVPGFLRAGGFRHNGACSAPDGLRNEGVPVGLRSFQGNVA